MKQEPKRRETHSKNSIQARWQAAVSRSRCCCSTCVRSATTGVTNRTHAFVLSSTEKQLGVTRCRKRNKNKNIHATDKNRHTEREGEIQHVRGASDPILWHILGALDRQLDKKLGAKNLTNTVSEFRCMGDTHRRKQRKGTAKEIRKRSVETKKGTKNSNYDTKLLYRSVLLVGTTQCAADFD